MVQKIAREHESVMLDPTFFVKQLSTGHKLTFPGIHSCVKYLSEGL